MLGRRRRRHYGAARQEGRESKMYEMYIQKGIQNNKRHPVARLYLGPWRAGVCPCQSTSGPAKGPPIITFHLE